jgi:hypothetical protein
MCRFDHNPLDFRLFTCQSGENTVKYAYAAPKDEPIIEQLVRPVFLWLVFSLHGETDHIDDTSDNSPVVDARNTARQREER